MGKSLLQSFIHSFVHLIVQVIVHSFIYSFIYSFIQQTCVFPQGLLHVGPCTRSYFGRQRTNDGRAKTGSKWIEQHNTTQHSATQQGLNTDGQPDSWHQQLQD